MQSPNNDKNIYLFLLWWRGCVLVVEYTVFYAVPVIAYVKTLNLSTSALTAVVEFLPRIIVLPLILTFIDRVPLLRQIAVSDAMRAILVGGLLLFHSLSALLVLLGLVGILSMWSVIKFEKLVAAIDDPALETEVISRSQGVDQLARVAGGVIATLAVQHLPLVAGSCVVLLATGYIALLHFRSRSAGILESGSWSGRRALTTQDSAPIVGLIRPLALLIGLLLSINLYDGILRTLLPNLVISRYGADAELVPVIMTISYLFGILMALIFERYVLKKSGITILFSSLGVLTASLVTMSLAPGATTFFFGAVVFFGGRVWFNIAARIARNRLIDRENFGRSLSLYLPAIFFPFVVAGVLVGALGRYFTANEMLFGLAAAALGSLVLLAKSGRTLVQRLKL